MAYVQRGEPSEWEIERLQVEIKTAPFEVPADSDFYYKLHHEILDRCKDIMRTWKVKADHIAGDHSSNTVAREQWTKILTDSMQVPVEVKCVYYMPSYDILENKLMFGIEMTEEIFKRFGDKHVAELTNLIDEVFGE